MKVYRSLVIDAPIDVVWAVVRDFGQVKQWNPGAVESWMESGEPTGAGGVRHLTAPDGGLFVETLLDHSDEAHSYTYRIDQSPLGVDDYVATHRLLPVTEGDQTFSEWTAEFTAPTDKEDKLDHIVGNLIFVNAMKGLAEFLA